MAKRDAQRHKIRTAATMLMIGVPVFIATLLVTAFPLLTHDVDYHQTLGKAGYSVAVSGDTATLPDWTDSPITNTTILGEHLGVTPHLDALTYLERSDSPTALSAVATDGFHLLGDRGRLLDGQWPSQPNEVVANQRLGLNIGDTLTIGAPQHAQQTFTVVGKAALFDHFLSPTDLAILPESAPQLLFPRWLIGSPGKATDAPINNLIATGHSVDFALENKFLTYLEYKVLDTLETTFLDFQLDYMGLFGFVILCALVLGSIIVFTTTPAFAIQTAERTRALALVAAVGARSHQLRLAALASTLVVAVPAIIAALVLAAFVPPIWQFGSDYGFLPARLSLTVPWVFALLWAFVGLIAAITAGLLPLQKMNTETLRETLRSTHGPTRPGLLKPCGGALFIAAGIYVMWRTTHHDLSNDIALAAAVPLFTIGALLFVPSLLHCVAKTATYQSFTLRETTRTMARQTHIFGPAIGVTLAAMAALTACVMYFSVDLDRQHATHTQFQATHTTMLHSKTPSADGPTRILPDHVKKATADQLSTIPGVTVQTINIPGSMRPTPDAPDETHHIAPPTCAPADVLTKNSGNPQPTACTGKIVTNDDIIILPANSIIQLFNLEYHEAHAVRGGAAVTLKNYGTETLQLVTSEDGTPATATTHTVQALVKTPSANGPLAHATAHKTPYLYLPQETATAANWRTTDGGFVLHHPGGPLSLAVKDAIEHIRFDNYDPSTVAEPPAQRTTFLTALTILAILAILITSASASVLLHTQQQRLHGLWHATGARLNARRRLAFTQGALPALLGGTLGAGIGITLTVWTHFGTKKYDDPAWQTLPALSYVSVPWAWILPILLATTLIAGCFAATLCATNPTRERHH